jgi:hypothetical protein
MPDPKEMSGIPRPVTDLPDGSLSVRLIKGDLSNNIAGHPVELHVNDRVQTVTTGADGRAQFDRLPPGATVKAVAVVDGERLESQEFPAPSAGGIRLMLVATDPEKERQKTADAGAQPITGQVVIGGESRIVIEPGEESFELYYILEIMNTARAPVNPSTPFLFTMPEGMVGTSVLEGSSPLASNDGEQVRVNGPFPPGKTIVRVGGSIPVTSGTVTLKQVFPAAFEQPLFVAKKDGQLTVSSPQFPKQQETVVEGGTTLIVGAGNTIAAGQTMSITLSGLAYRDSTPQMLALSFAVGIMLIGALFGMRVPDTKVLPNDRKRLIGRREKLLQDLVRLERDRRRGRGNESRYPARREELMSALEQVYAALDAEAARPDAVDRAGVPTRPLGHLGAS